MECTRCGADLDPSATECSYCRAPTPHAERVRAEEQARRDRESALRGDVARREQVDARSKLELAASRSLMFCLIGVVICFIPVLQIVSIVFYLRARSLARQLSTDVPLRATTAFFVSAAWLVMIPVFLVWAIVRDNNLQDKADARIAALDSQVKVGAARAALDWATACALAERHALTTGYADQKGKNLVHFDCPGGFTGGATTSMLEHFMFGNDLNDTNYDVAVCFARGATWYVKEMNTTHKCPEPEPVPPSEPGSRPLAR